MPASAPLARPPSPLVAAAHAAWRAALAPGDLAIDATAGNGHDTAVLAELVGPRGRVLAFDVQPAALAATRARLERAGLAERVDLLLADHATLATHLDGRAIAAAAFNLGYLPGAAHDVVTRPDGTRAALAAALAHLAPGGVVTVVAYTGHAGGRADAAAALAVARALDPERFAVARECPSRARHAPFLVTIRRRA